MEHRQRRSTSKQVPVINPDRFGVSFSLKQCRNFKVNQQECLQFLLDLGFRRFRLMSYWNEHEKAQGTYNFKLLDQQCKQIEQAGGIITLCLGVRQPRWPESHWPQWALELPQEERYQALQNYIETVVRRYSNRSYIINWQLENEALNRGFGKNGDFNRERLRKELELVKTLDPHRPIVMSTSNSWGIPFRRPRPDTFGFTLYQTQFASENYSYNRLPIWWWPLRAKVIRLTTGKPSFIHELQTEPWGPKAIWEMSNEEQSKSMNVAQLKTNIQLAKQTKLHPIDLWGGEWWYWRWLRGDQEIAETVRQQLTEV